MSAASPEVQQFIKDFYAASDVGPSGHQAYADMYTTDGTLVMGPKQFAGHEGILQWRESAWEAVATRKHVVQGVYPSPTNSEKDIMLYGYVDYGLKEGGQKTAEWAARMDLTKDSQGSLKLQFYQVYLTLK